MKNILGFSYDHIIFDVTFPEIPDKKRAIFRVHKLFPEFIWDTTWLENNPYTFPEVKTLLEGITVGGHRIEEETQVLNQAKSWKRLMEMVKENKFSLSREIFCELQGIVAREEALKWGEFRTSQVSIAGTAYKPPASEDLNIIFEKGIQTIREMPNPIERGMVFYLFGALNQFFYDGNKRTSRLMMNGELLMYGYDAISIPAKEKLQYNETMIRFYDTQHSDRETALSVAAMNESIKVFIIRRESKCDECGETSGLMPG